MWNDYHWETITYENLKIEPKISELIDTNITTEKKSHSNKIAINYQQGLSSRYHEQLKELASTYGLELVYSKNRVSENAGFYLFEGDGNNLQQECDRICQSVSHEMKLILLFSTASGERAGVRKKIIQLFLAKNREIDVVEKARPDGTIKPKFTLLKEIIEIITRS